MAWIESHQRLRDHPKTKRLARLLGVSVPTAIGHLHLLWWWALDYADSGDLAGFTNDDVADAMLWDGDSDLLVDALLGCGIGGGHGFLERGEHGGLAIHDWMEYAGKLVQQREESKARLRAWRAIREANKQHTTAETPPPDASARPVTDAFVTDSKRVLNGVTLPNLTVPNLISPQAAGADAPKKASPRASRPRTPKTPKAEDSEAKPGRPRQWGEQEEALADGLHVAPGQLPPPAARQFFSAAAWMGQAGWHREAIIFACEEHKRLWPNLLVTPTSVMQHIGEFVGQSNGRGPSRNGKPRAPNVMHADGTITDAEGNIVGREDDSALKLN